MRSGLCVVGCLSAYLCLQCSCSTRVRTVVLVAPHDSNKAECESTRTNQQVTPTSARSGAFPTNVSDCPRTRAPTRRARAALARVRSLIPVELWRDGSWYGASSASSSSAAAPLPESKGGVISEPILLLRLSCGSPRRPTLPCPGTRRGPLRRCMDCRVDFRPARMANASLPSSELSDFVSTAASRYVWRLEKAAPLLRRVDTW